MKKLVISVGLMLGIGLTQASAQNLSCGVKADGNLSNFIVKDMPGSESKMKIGASFGGFMKYDLTQKIAIQPELLFHYKTSDSKAVVVKNTFKYWGMEIPVYLVGQWSVGANGRFYAGVGPHLGVGFSAKYTKGDIDLYDTEAMHRWDFGGGARVGYEFGGGLQINAGYKMGFINALDKTIGNAVMRPQMVSLGIGFRF
jgi:hypothetical protein